MKVNGATIKKYRQELGLTQVDLAKELGITQGTLAQYETGRRKPKIETLKRIADGLCVPWTELCEDVDEHSIATAGVEYSSKLFMAVAMLGKDEEIKPGADGMAQLFNVKRSNQTKLILEKIEEMLNTLNKDGQEEALKRIKELTYIPEYQKAGEPDGRADKKTE